MSENELETKTTAQTYDVPTSALDLAEQLEDLMREATQGQWAICRKDCGSVEALVSESSEMIRVGGSEYHWLWAMDHNEEAIAPCMTGNGPTSEANARFICALVTAAPTLIRYARAVGGLPVKVRKA